MASCRDAERTGQTSLLQFSLDLNSLCVSPVNMGSFLIVGCGHFGSRAVERLLQKDPHASITVIDRDPKALDPISQLPVKTVVCDGKTDLSRFVHGDKRPDYIIPAVPYHLAFEYILSQLKPLGAKRAQVPSLQGLPNPIMGKTGDLYASLADFLCPEDCQEPPRVCTVTGKRRPKPLYQYLMDLKGLFESSVIRSVQLGPGVGGFRPEILLNLIETIKKRRGSNRPFLISTACRCHGVISALSF